MTRRLAMAACVAVRAWTWLYTLPLDAAAQRARRDEIDSDLWEFCHDHSRAGAGGSAAVHIVAGAVLAVPDDLLWTCDQIPNHVHLPRMFALVRYAIAVLAASGLVVSASGPTLNVASILSVNVASAGWLPIATRGAESTLVPAFAFTLTNNGDRATGALQVNAVFYREGRNPEGMGTAFSPVVGWRGLSPGTSSGRVVLRGRGEYVVDASALALRTPFPSFGAADVTVRVLVQHEGRWAVVGEFPISARVIHP